jgi:DNA-binding transcriptional ArsR family regulator
MALPALLAWLLPWLPLFLRQVLCHQGIGLDLICVNAQLEDCIARGDAPCIKAALDSELLALDAPSQAGGGFTLRTAEALDIAAPTLSFHLAALAQAGLVTSARDGRSIVYAAEFGAMRGLVDFLTENCCGGGGARCAPPTRGRTSPRKGARK